LTPHCNGTHTECVAHLTLEPLDAWRIVPAAPVPALVVSVAPVPAGEDLVVTRAALESAWSAGVMALPPIALILRTAVRDARGARAEPPWVAADAVEFVVGQGFMHLVVDQPSLDRTHDAGRLAAHRAFFGLPAGSRRLADATRPRATVTEYASVPDALPDGPCALAWQVPAIAGDAVPSRPLAYRYES
jgi:kynurenine formamidase